MRRQHTLIPVVSGVILNICITMIPHTGKTATTAQLTSVLQKYGVPYAKDCGTKNEAHYNGSKPECQEIGMYYNASKRRCEYCELGYITTDKTSTSCKAIVCPAGMGGTIIRNGVCPAGYGLTQITGGSCPAGTTIWKYSS